MRACPPHSTPPAAAAVAGEGGDDDVEDGDDAADNGHDDGADAVDNGHEHGADGSEDALDLLFASKVSLCVPRRGYVSRAGRSLQGEGEGYSRKIRRRPL